MPELPSGKHYANNLSIFFPRGFVRLCSNKNVFFFDRSVAPLSTSSVNFTDDPFKALNQKEAPTLDVKTATTSPEEIARRKTFAASTIVVRRNVG